MATKPAKFRRYINLGGLAWLLPLSLVAGVAYVGGRNAQHVLQIAHAAPGAVAPIAKQLAAISSALPSLPAVAQDLPEGFSRRLSPPPDATNLLALHAEDLADPLAEPSLPVRVCEPRVLLQPLRLAREGLPGLSLSSLDLLTEDPKKLQQPFDDLAGIRWILVVRDVRFTPPRLHNDREFDNGYYRGEALLFDGLSARYIGGFRFGASIEMSVAAATTAGETALVGRLVANARAALADAIHTIMPAVWDVSAPTFSFE